jgi:hypothetical protein
MIKVIKRLLSTLINLIKGNWPPNRPIDPYAGAPVRNKRGPNNRNSAVALAEPDE